MQGASTFALWRADRRRRGTRHEELTITLRYRSHVGLPADVRSAIVDDLQVVLAGAVDLGSQLKHAHWNVRGEGFHAAHVMFDAFADHARTWSDELAERIAQLGAVAHGTVRAAAERSPLPECDVRAVLVAEHIRSLTTQYGLLGAIVRSRTTTRDAMRDPVTFDLYARVLASLERDLWMLDSHLERGVSAPMNAPDESAGVPHVTAD